MRSGRIGIIIAGVVLGAGCSLVLYLRLPSTEDDADATQFIPKEGAAPKAEDAPPVLKPQVPQLPTENISILEFDQEERHVSEESLRVALQETVDKIPAHQEDTLAANLDVVVVERASASTIVRDLRRNLKVPLRFEAAEKEVELSFQLENVGVDEILARIALEDPRYEVAKVGAFWSLRLRDSPLKTLNRQFSVRGRTRVEALGEIGRQIQEQVGDRFEVAWLHVTGGTRIPDFDQVIDSTVVGDGFDALELLASGSDSIVWNVAWQNGRAVLTLDWINPARGQVPSRLSIVGSG